VQWGDYDGDGDADLLMNDLVFRNNGGEGAAEPPPIDPPPTEPGEDDPVYRAGDSNRDLQFDQLDIILVLQGQRYLTQQPATFQQGDWNGDGVFDQWDILAALQGGNYLRGPYEARAADSVFSEDPGP
jgi:hypothetical protein